MLWQDGQFSAVIYWPTENGTTKQFGTMLISNNISGVDMKNKNILFRELTLSVEDSEYVSLIFLQISMCCVLKIRDSIKNLFFLSRSDFRGQQFKSWHPPKTHTWGRCLAAMLALYTGKGVAPELKLRERILLSCWLLQESPQSSIKQFSIKEWNQSTLIRDFIRLIDLIEKWRSKTPSQMGPIVIHCL